MDNNTLFWLEKTRPTLDENIASKKQEVKISKNFEEMRKTKFGSAKICGRSLTCLSFILPYFAFS